MGDVLPEERTGVEKVGHYCCGSEVDPATVMDTGADRYWRMARASLLGLAVLSLLVAAGIVVRAKFRSGPQPCAAAHECC